ncbi:hypothetical protein BLNAU_9015 [Blattamonas nauphoetae]|uniref:Cyclin N-terminal domain-containing protein n=1 Tax=Blattamonas nauphoetae TaxID=2049346 RepID=A0ABQ9XX29_9EUKA|nr:hypothetical protein BLNAU_9015 [Blattamonas nauphoetae]
MRQDRSPPHSLNNSDRRFRMTTTINTTFTTKTETKHFNSDITMPESNITSMAPIFSLPAKRDFADRVSSSIVEIVHNLNSAAPITVDTSLTSCEACERIGGEGVSRGVFPLRIPSRESLGGVLSEMMSVLMNSFKITETELVCSIRMFEGILKKHWTCSGFCVLRNNIHALFLVCVVLAHKCNADVPFKQVHWGRSFGVPWEILNIFESFSLRLLDWNVTPSTEEYYETKRGIEGMERRF